jgi:hypothetical protein
MAADIGRWMAAELVKRPTPSEGHPDRPKAAPYQPNPAGVPFQNAASAAVLELLKAHKGAPLRRWQIVAKTGRTDKAVQWALAYLQAIHLIEAHSDGSHSRYLRYQIARSKESKRA